MGVDILALWHHAGPFAKGIVITLLIMSFFSLTIALNKLWQIHKSAAATRKFASHFSRSIQEESSTRPSPWPRRIRGATSPGCWAGRSRK